MSTAARTSTAVSSANRRTTRRPDIQRGRRKPRATASGRTARRGPQSTTSTHPASTCSVTPEQIIATPSAVMDVSGANQSPCRAGARATRVATARIWSMFMVPTEAACGADCDAPLARLATPGSSGLARHVGLGSLLAGSASPEQPFANVGFRARRSRPLVAPSCHWRAGPVCGGNRPLQQAEVGGERSLRLAPREIGCSSNNGRWRRARKPKLGRPSPLSLHAEGETRTA